MKKDSENKTGKTLNRRNSLKVIATGAASAGIGEKWGRPIVQAILLPAHAATSFAATCEINFRRDMHATGNSSLLQVLKTGTNPQDTDIEGVYSGVMPGAETSQGSCKETFIGFQSLPLTITIERLN